MGCISLCRSEESNHMPFKENEENSAFRVRAWNCLVYSHFQSSQVLKGLSHRSPENALCGASLPREIGNRAKTEETRQLVDSLEQEHRRVLGGKCDELRLLEKLVVEQKAEQDRLRDELGAAGLRLTASQQAEARLEGMRMVKDNLREELDKSRSCQDEVVTGLKKRHEAELSLCKAELDGAKQDVAVAQGDVAKKQAELADLLLRSNKKIDEANDTIISLKTERDALAKQLEEVEIAKNTQQIQLQSERENLVMDKNNLNAQNMHLKVKNEELLKIVTSLYDSSSDHQVQLHARESIDAYTAKWS